jgi:hypothetical protein
VCRNDFDCCGFGGMQGSTGVGSCNKTNPTDEVGRCDNGNACRPAGAVCKLATSSCNAENNCCAGNVNQNPLVCQQDLLGIPRCTMSGQPCADAGSKAGQRCATSADCCGLACTPNPSFDPTRPNAEVPPFICGGSCVAAGGDCSTTADCCPGMPCVSTPGSTRGKCGSVPPGADAGMPPTPDGATPPDPDAGVPPDPDAGGSDDAGPDGGVCSEYGQTCRESSNCCNYPSIMCTNGRCIVIINWGRRPLPPRSAAWLIAAAATRVDASWALAL